MWIIFKVFIEFVTMLLLFRVLLFWPQGMWDFSSPTRNQPTSSALEGEVLTTGPPGKPLGGPSNVSPKGTHEDFCLKSPKVQPGVMHVLRELPVL